MPSALRAAIILTSWYPLFSATALAQPAINGPGLSATCSRAYSVLEALQNPWELVGPLSSDRITLQGGPGRGRVIARILKRFYSDGEETHFSVQLLDDQLKPVRQARLSRVQLLSLDPKPASTELSDRITRQFGRQPDPDLQEFLLLDRAAESSRTARVAEAVSQVTGSRYLFVTSKDSMGMTAIVPAEIVDAGMGPRGMTFSVQILDPSTQSLRIERLTEADLRQLKAKPSTAAEARMKEFKRTTLPPWSGLE